MTKFVSYSLALLSRNKSKVTVVFFGMAHMFFFKKKIPPEPILLQRAIRLVTGLTRERSGY
jgi:hypothetical protein